MAEALESVIDRFVREVEEETGAGLEAIVLYGSASSQAFVPGRSDLNFLIVLARVEMAVLDGFQKRMKAWRRKRIAAPLVVDRAFLLSSTDSYPLEILGMMASYRLLRGSDPFDGLVLKREEVRLQAEREARVKGLLLRSIRIESGGNERELRGALAASVTAMDAILHGILFLTGAHWKELGDAFRKRGAEAAGIDPSIQLEAAALRRGERRPSHLETVRLYDRMLGAFDALSARLDEIGK